VDLVELLLGELGRSEKEREYGDADSDDGQGQAHERVIEREGPAAALACPAVCGEPPGR
jgi:hypothetical protein